MEDLGPCLHRYVRAGDTLGRLRCFVCPTAMGRPESSLRIMATSTRILPASWAIGDRSDAVDAAVDEEEHGLASISGHIALINRRLSMMSRYQGKIEVRAVLALTVLISVCGNRAMVRA